MKEELIFKKASTENIEDITRLLIGYREFYEQQPASTEVISCFIQERLINSEVVILLAYIANTAVGIAQLYSGYSTLSLGKIWTLYDLYIDQNYRGRKIGKSLLEQCQAFAKNDGGFRLELKTEHNNLPAKALYERFGFSKDDTYVHYQMQLKKQP